MTETIHATAVQINGSGILLRGSSGSGKSDLALRLLDQGAVLIADDQVCCEKREGAVFLSAPASLAGLIEIRGLGLMRFPFVSDVALRLVVDLVPQEDVARMPEAVFVRICGDAIPCFQLCPWQASAPVKIRQFLISVLDPGRVIR
jgi:serine kinase of HPr protein (carbohydrate metabolism regulator)